MPLVLTAQNLDAEGMQVVLSRQDCPHPDDKEVSKAGDKSHDPHRHTKNHISKQIFKRRESIWVRFTLSDMWGVRAVLKLLEISKKKITWKLNT